MANEFWFKFNFKDWQNDVRPLSLAARGLLLELIIYLRQTKQVGRMPIDVGLMCRLSGGLTPEITHALTEFREHGLFNFEVDAAGVEWIVSRRIEKEYRMSLISKENGKKGGNPKLVLVNPQVNEGVNPSVNPSPNSNSISISNNNSEKGLSREKHKSRPQDENECLEYFCELNRPDEAQKFFDYFSSNGWKVGGKAPMKDWKAAARNWIRNARGTPNEERGERVFGKVHKKDLIDTYEKLKEYEQEQQLRGTDNREAQDQQGALSDANH